MENLHITDPVAYKILEIFIKEEHEIWSHKMIIAFIRIQASTNKQLAGLMLATRHPVSLKLQDILKLHLVNYGSTE